MIFQDIPQMSSSFCPLPVNTHLKHALLIGRLKITHIIKKKTLSIYWYHSWLGCAELILVFSMTVRIQMPHQFLYRIFLFVIMNINFLMVHCVYNNQKVHHLHSNWVRLQPYLVLKIETFFDVSEIQSFPRWIVRLLKWIYFSTAGSLLAYDVIKLVYSVPFH